MPRRTWRKGNQDTDYIMKRLWYRLLFMWLLWYTVNYVFSPMGSVSMIFEIIVDLYLMRTVCRTAGEPQIVQTLVGDVKAVQWCEVIQWSNAEAWATKRCISFFVLREDALSPPTIGVPDVSIACQVHHRLGCKYSTYEFACSRFSEAPLLHPSMSRYLLCIVDAHCITTQICTSTVLTGILTAPA